jgi:hypothetical protein
LVINNRPKKCTRYEGSKTREEERIIRMEESNKGRTSKVIGGGKMKVKIYCFC